MAYDFDDLDRLTALALKYVAGSLSPEEDEELSAFLEQPGYRELFGVMIDPEAVAEEWPVLEKAQAWEGPSLEKIRSRLDPLYRQTRLFSVRRWGLVAAGAMGLSFGVYFFQKAAHSGKGPENVVAKSYDLLPGGQKAVLTLASGKRIVLDSVRKGRLESETGATIDKVDSGVIAYVPDKVGEVPEKAAFNTLSTPQKGMYEVLLPDGSEVVLNSASSLRYPDRFSGKDAREVELTGEAYFRVARDADRPFRVKVGGQTVEVLGTEFNVKAYADEPDMKTTLLSGSVRVSEGTGSVLLQPGEQSLGKDGELRLVGPVDTDQVVAWKNGMFRWNGATLEEVMRDLSRWYGVQVVYKGPAPKQKLIAVVGRNLPATEVLKAIEISGGYHFNITGLDRIEVTP